MHRRNTMTIEIHQDEIILTSEFTVTIQQYYFPYLHPVTI